MLPNLIVIGAAKAGTTSLHRYLDLHPEIAMSKWKELDFFVQDADEASLRWYESQFTDAPVRGESSPSYTRYPENTGAAPRIAALIPDAKLIYIVRDPVDRFISSYRFNRHALGKRQWGLAEDLEHEQGFHTSRYGTQFAFYLEHFPREQILVLDHADLDSRTAETMATAFRFAGVDDTFASPGFEQRHNVTVGESRPNRVGRAAVAVSERVIGERRTMTLRRMPHGAVPFLVHRPEVPDLELEPEQRARLEELLRPDIERFRQQTGMAFEHWSI